MFSLTFRQMRVLQFIREQIKATGIAPTRIEMARKLGFASLHELEQQLEQLARARVIELQPGKARAIRLLELPDSVGLPVLGKLRAGQPAPAWFYSMVESFAP
jgi:repressor LexA